MFFLTPLTSRGSMLLLGWSGGAMVQSKLAVPGRPATVELQWLEHRWLVYHGCFELVLESLGKTHPMQICDNLE